MHFIHGSCRENTEPFALNADRHEVLEENLLKEPIFPNSGIFYLNLSTATV